MSAIRKPVPQMTTAEFLAWEPGDGRLWQLVDGQPQAMAPASTTHGRLQAELARLIGNHLVERKSSCWVLSNAGTRPQVNADQNIRIPDLSVTCDTLAAGTRLVERPCLIIEILSASNRAETWSNVWTYTSQPSVQEILVVSSLAVEIHALRREEAGGWPERPSKFSDGRIVFESIDFELPLLAIYRGTGLHPVG